MFIKQRQVRRSEKFTSKFATASRHRREYATSIYATGAVQFVLAVFLIISAVRAFIAMRAKLPDLSWTVTYGVPVGVALIALIVLKWSIGNFQHGLDVYRRQRDEKP